MSSVDFTGHITVENWQEYQNLKANFHRYTECYAREQHAPLARIDDLQIANVRLQDKLVAQEQQNRIYNEQRDRNALSHESVPQQRNLNRRASLYDGSWTNSLQSTMVSPFPPTVFSPTVSLTKTRKPSLVVSIPPTSSLSLSSTSSELQNAISVTVEPTNWSSSPVSTLWQRREEKQESPVEYKVTSDRRPEWILEDVPFSYGGSWADIDFEDDLEPPPGTSVSAPAGSFPSSDAAESVQYAMVLVDVSHVKFPLDNVLRGREGGYSFIEILHRSIVEQLAKQNLPPITDPLMIRMIVRHGDYGNSKQCDIGVKQMEDFCLGMRTHMSSMPLEQVPNDRFKDTPSALLSALRMCLNDEDCQRVFVAVDPSLPVYLDDLRNLLNLSSLSKMTLLCSMPNNEHSSWTCLNLRHVLTPASETGKELDTPWKSRRGVDEARWIPPPTYSAVAKLPPQQDRCDSKTPLAQDGGSDRTETWNALPQPVTIPPLPIVHVISDFRGIQEIKRQYGQHPCARYHLEGTCSPLDQQTCPHLHQEIEFTKDALDRYRRYVYSQPCPRGVSCRPGMVPDCKLKHTCPWSNKCLFAQRKNCLFDAFQFQNQGHQPNEASKIYDERRVQGVVEKGGSERQGQMNSVKCFKATVTSGDEDPNLSLQDFQPMLIVLRSMNQSNSQTRQLRARANELIQARFPGIYPRLGIINFKKYSLLAEAAGLIEMGRNGEGRDWIALTEQGKQSLMRK